MLGESQPLRHAANLLIIAGNRDDIRDMESGAQSVLTNILLLIDAYDLYGRVAVPKSHRAAEVADIYRLVAAGKGVFINPALTEPFGLTLLEAFRCGCPVVASVGGSHPEVAGDAARLVPEWDAESWSAALRELLGDSSNLAELRQRGPARAAAFSWDETARLTAEVYREVLL